MKGLLGQLTAVFGGAQKVIRAVSPPAPDATTSGSIQDAIVHHQAGHLREAETIYRRILHVDPDNFDALHISGLVCHQKGISAQAIALISQAVAIQPTHPFAQRRSVSRGVAAAADAFVADWEAERGVGWMAGRVEICASATEAKQSKREAGREIMFTTEDTEKNKSARSGPQISQITQSKNNTVDLT